LYTGGTTSVNMSIPHEFATSHVNMTHLRVVISVDCVISPDSNFVEHVQLSMTYRNLQLTSRFSTELPLDIGTGTLSRSTRRKDYVK
jgi:hypothetical protein